MKEGNWKFLVGLIIGLIPYFGNFFFLTKHEENAILQSLIQEFTSDDPVRIDLALEVLKDTVSDGKYQKYKGIIDRKISKTIESAWSTDRPLNPEALRKKLELFALVRPEWQSLVEAQDKLHRERLNQVLSESKEKELKTQRDRDFKQLLELGSKRLDLNDCFGAYTAFKKAQDYDYGSPAIDAGLTIARNCMPRDRRDSIENMEQAYREIEKRVSKMSRKELVDELNRDLGQYRIGPKSNEGKTNK